MLIRKRDGSVLIDTESGWDLSEFDLREADLRGADIEGGNFSDSNLEGVDFSNSFFYGGYFYRANCRGCTFTGAIFQRVVFDEVDFTDADFGNAKLLRDNMAGLCSVSGANLKHAKLDDADLSGCSYDNYTQFPQGFDPVSNGMIREVQSDPT